MVNNEIFGKGYVMKTISRRDALRTGALAFSGLALNSSNAMPAKKQTRPAKAKSVIQIWMWGGPCHIDTFDPKPEAGTEYIGPYTKPIETNVSGIRIGQMLPKMAKQADKYSIIRSMTHGINAHETASYIVQTGFKAGDGISHPCAGAIVSYFKGSNGGYKGLLPPYIVITGPQGRFSESGFLGLRYKPFATGGDPAKTPFLVEGIVIQGLTEKRQKQRRELLQKLDILTRTMDGNEQIGKMQLCREQAYELILGDTGKVFDLTQEKESLREKYGKNTFGQSCLLARRLVERGVPYITINYKGWDTHKKHFETMQRKLPELDAGLATLIEDLADRGLLESTIVWWGGEFGRGPKIQWEAPWNGGRSHWGKAFCHVVAGGGFAGGQVIGATNDRGTEVADRPVYPWDLLSSIYMQMGIDPTSMLQTPQGSMVRITPTAEDGVTVGGYLKEIIT